MYAGITLCNIESWKFSEIAWECILLLPSYFLTKNLVGVAVYGRVGLFLRKKFQNAKDTKVSQRMLRCLPLMAKYEILFSHSAGNLRSSWNQTVCFAATPPILFVVRGENRSENFEKENENQNEREYQKPYHFIP